MMSFKALVLTGVLMSIFASCSADEEMYTTEYDHLDVSSILASKRLRDNYISCFLDKGSCTAAGQYVKEHITDALDTECRKCNEKQIDNTRIIATYLYEKEPETLALLTTKYDPDGKYYRKFQNYVKTHDISQWRKKN